MNKNNLVKKIIDHLSAELAVYHKAARAAHDEATHEQSKAENKYDTRGLEASYLARGQSRQAAEIVESIEQFKRLSPKIFSLSDPIDLGAVVELQNERERTFYFIVPRAGGLEIFHDKKEILLISPQSPLGQRLAGKRQGDLLQTDLAGAQKKFQIVSVC